MDVISSLIGICIAIALADAAMWFLFSRKVRPLCFPEDAKAQCFKRLRLGSLRIFTALHALITAASISFALLLLW